VTVTVLWLTPIAFAGLVLLAIPIVIHLLARQHSRRVPFPSLRFVPASQLAALRRRAVADWPLLLVRVAILVAAVVAAATPVLVSDTRRAGWESRVARAIVVSGENDEANSRAQQEEQTSVFSARFTTNSLADGIKEAETWLAVQPPAAREVVVIGALRDGVLAAADLATLSPHVGVRFVPLSPSGPAVRQVGAVAELDGAIRQVQMTITAERDLTRGEQTRAEDVVGSRIRLIAPAADQPYADALRRAVLRSGLVIDDDDRSITVLFDGSEQSARATPPQAMWMREVLQRHPGIEGGESEGRLVVHAGMRIADSRAPSLVEDLLRATFAPSFSDMEPRLVPAGALAQWSRPPGSLPADVLPDDEGDRRWLWGAALLLLMVEQFLRRRRHA
jgi:hypothetical protein